MLEIVKMEKAPFSDVSEHEERHFTYWSSDNLETIEEIQGIEFSLVEENKVVEPFKEDILSEDENIILMGIYIENEFGEPYYLFPPCYGKNSLG